MITDECVLDVLLGDGRAALDVTAEQVIAHCAGEAGDREPGVGVEVAILGGHHGVADVHRYLIDIDIDPVALGRNDLRELGSVAGQNRRHLIGANVT